MIHIAKSAHTGLFHTATIATNGEELSSSEGLSSKENAIKNISAHLESWQTHFVFVQDDTYNDSKIITVYPGGIHELVSDEELEKRDILIQTKYTVGE